MKEKEKAKQRAGFRSYNLDPSIEAYYNASNEKDRLSQEMWQIERERTLRILKKTLPPAPAVILDIGGGAGAYAFPLAIQGYQVHLFDPVSLHIQQAVEYQKETGVKLGSCQIGDARKIEYPDSSADAVLLFGPLYHLVEHSDRLLALSEAHRMLKPKGILMAVSISRFSSLMDGIYQSLLLDPDFWPIVEQDLATGQHRGLVEKYFTTAYLHRPDEFKEEIADAGFKDISLLAVEGPVWNGDLVKLKQSEAALEQTLSFIEAIEEDTSILGASAHIMAIARK